MTAKRLPVPLRKEIFLTLVTSQDTGELSVAQSREKVVKQYGITDAQLRQIEEEGLEHEWPPLDEAVQRAS